MQCAALTLRMLLAGGPAHREGSLRRGDIMSIVDGIRSDLHLSADSHTWRMH